MPHEWHQLRHLALACVQAETSELAKQVEAREADIKGVEVVAAGEDALFLQACDKVHTQLWYVSCLPPH